MTNIRLEDSQTLTKRLAMKHYFVKTPRIIQSLFPDYTWKIDTSNKEIYLTFDDGPIPKVTPWVLDILEKYKAKGTFFCVGENITKHPEIYKQIINQKHVVGNHTFNHLDGWKTNTKKYITNIEKAEEIIINLKAEDRRLEVEGRELETRNSKPETHNPKLFRPPYGKIKSKQAKALQKNGHQIIMWDVLSGDFDQKTSKEKCLENVIKNSKNGSIVVFHDSKKAFKNLQYSLPKTLEYFSEKGYVFKTL